MSREELAWCAGFFDGEGSVGYYSGRIMVQIAQVDRKVLDRFHDAVGVGRVDGPHLPRSGHKPQYKFVVSSHTNVQHIMASLWPWLDEVKREQFLAAIHSFLAARREPCSEGHTRQSDSRGSWYCPTCRRAKAKEAA